MRRARRSSGREPTIALINVVFLMLVFFMVTSRVAPPMERGLTLVRTSELELRPPPDALVLTADGALRFRGEAVADPAAFVAMQDGEVVKIVPDRALDAQRLVAVSGALRRAGAGRIVIVTERALE